MTNKEIIALYEQVVIQIATPYTTGTGFYLKEYDMIVTNEHVVRDNREVVIKGDSIEKQLTKILFLDVLNDIAFLKPPDKHNMPSVRLGDIEDLVRGDTVIAVGHPFGLTYTSTQGIISNLVNTSKGKPYISHDAALNPGNSGGPLLNDKGKIVGVNTFVMRKGNDIGFSLPVNVLKNILVEFQDINGFGVRCASCRTIVIDKEIPNRYCTQCGAEIKLISDIPIYEALGIKKTIEIIIEQLGFEIDLSRRGSNNWIIIRGSATINISYHEKTGLIIADAYLCTIGNIKIDKLYTYLLKENYISDGLTFSVKERDIILSILIYDQYLNIDSGIALFGHLFESADKYDNILVEKYGANWEK